MMNSMFEDKWILTGSEAVRLYADYLGLGQHYPIAPRDVDIMYVHQGEFRDNNFFGFQRVQANPGRSMTFRNPTTGREFDVTLTRGPLSYYEINGVRLINPRVMLEDYEDNLDLRGDRRNANTVKINALRNIIYNLEQIAIQPQRLDASGRRAAATLTFGNPKKQGLFNMHNNSNNNMAVPPLLFGR
jgi:hypothetical protein